MPILTIDISEETAAHFAALPTAGKTELARRVNAFVNASFPQNERETDGSETDGSETKDSETDEEGAAWWNSLTPQEQENYRAKMMQSFADLDAGCTHSAEEVYARIRAKYANRTNA